MIQYHHVFFGEDYLMWMRVERIASENASEIIWKNNLIKWDLFK